MCVLTLDSCKCYFEQLAISFNINLGYTRSGKNKWHMFLSFDKKTNWTNVKLILTNQSIRKTNLLIWFQIHIGQFSLPRTFAKLKTRQEKKTAPIPTEYFRNWNGQCSVRGGQKWFSTNLFCVYKTSFSYLVPKMR